LIAKSKIKIWFWLCSKLAAQLKDCALCHHCLPLDAKAEEPTRCHKAAGEDMLKTVHWL
jgi:hypothetical protein